MNARTLLLAPLAVAVLRAAPADAQVRAPAPATSDVEAGEVAGFFVGVRAGAALSATEEIFHGLGRGVTVGVDAGVDFDNALSFQLAVTGARLSDDLADEAAWIVDVSLEPAGRWSRAGWRLRIGPRVGYAWVDRGIQEDRARGLVLGLAANAARGLTPTLDLGVGAAVTWSAFDSPTLVGGPLDDPDGQARGRRIHLDVGLTYRWPR